MKHDYEARYELMETFEKNSSELYWLAYLLTGNSDQGVQVFDRALDFDEEENPVFGGFMSAWARKLIIVEALGTIEKDLRSSVQRVARTAGDDMMGNSKWSRRPYIEKEEFEEAVIGIDTFPRCAMLLTIFEGMSIKTASVLLNASEALTRAAQRIGIVQLTRTLAGDRGWDSYFALNPMPVLSLN